MLDRTTQDICENTEEMMMMMMMMIIIIIIIITGIIPNKLD